MRIPWVSDAIDRRVNEAVERAASDFRQAASSDAKIEVVQGIAAEMARGWDMAAQIPQGYPQTVGSPYPLYGFDNPYRYSVPTSPKRRPDSPVSVETLRMFADTWDPLRSIINQLKREMEAQPFKIVPKDPKNKSTRIQNRVLAAERFFTKKGGLGEQNEHRKAYESKLYEDVLVVGAGAAWKNRTKGGELVQVLTIDASTIRPRMDAYGWPGPGEDWYEQWIMGMLITGFKPEEITYDGLWPVTNSPYFRSPVEYLIATCLSGVAADTWNRVWLTDGNIPGRGISIPDSWGTQQIFDFMDRLEQKYNGDSRARQKLFPLTGGMKMTDSHSRKDQDFTEFENNLIMRACGVFGVQPASIGRSSHQYKVSQDASHEATTQFGTGQLLRFRNAHYNDILEDLGYTDLIVQEDDGIAETPTQAAQRQNIQSGGVASKTPNEIRQENGDEPVEGGDVLYCPTIIGPLGQKPEAQETPKDEPKDSAEEDLNRWMRKSLKRVKEGKSAACSFSSTIIPAATLSVISVGLERCKDSAAVQKLFTDARPSIRRADETDDDDERADEKKKKIVAVLIRVLKQVAKGVYGAAVLTIEGSVSQSEFVNAVMAELTERHTEGAYLGRLRAEKGEFTDFSGITDADKATGTAQAETQRKYVEGFAEDLVNGDVSKDQAKVRADMYAQRVVGTANRAWLDTLTKDTVVNWIDVGDKSECEDCMNRAANSPYTPDTVPSVPGDGSTICVTLCRCFLETDDGERSFYDPRDEEIEP